MVAAFGLSNTLDVAETLVGLFYCFSLLLNTDDWLKQNMKSIGANDKFFGQIIGACCVGLRLATHHTRTVGGGKDLALGGTAIKLDYAIASTWAIIAYLNHNNEGLYTEKGKMNKMVCAAFAGALLARGAGLLPQLATM
jgi:hypothetical protein